MRLEATAAVKLGAVVLAAMAILLPLAAYFHGSSDGEVVRTCAVGGALLVLSAAMMAMLARTLRDHAFDDGLSTNAFAPMRGVDMTRGAAPVSARVATPAREARRSERPSVATRAR